MRTPRVWLIFLSNGQTGGYTLKCSLEVRVYFAHCGLHRAPLGLHYEMTLYETRGVGWGGRFKREGCMYTYG